MADDMEWTPEGEVQVTEGRKTRAPKGLKRSYRKGGSGYTLTVRLDKYAVYCRALDKSMANAVADADRAFVTTGQKIQRETGQKKITPEMGQEQSFAMIEARQRVYYEALKSCVLGWELPDDDGSPLPLDVEVLEFADVTRLLTAIQQKSTVGQSEENF